MELEIPYTNYSRAFITDLNKRQDILGCPSLQPLLNELSANVSRKITLESLFNAPAEQLQQYKVLFNKLMDTTDRGQTDHGLLLKAAQKLDAMLLVVQKHTVLSTNTSLSSFELDLDSLTLNGSNPILSSKEDPFETQVDCSNVVDIVNGAPMHYELGSHRTLVLRDDFLLMPEGSSAIRVHLALRDDSLLICKEKVAGKFPLLYPAIPLGSVSVQAAMLDRELIGEYIAEFTVFGKKKLIMRAYSKETRNTWVGLQGSEPAALKSTPRSLSLVVQKHLPARERSNSVDSDDIALHTLQQKPLSASKQQAFSFFMDNSADASSVDSSSDEEEINRGHPSQPTTPLTPLPKDTMLGGKKALPQVPMITAEKSLPPAPLKKDHGRSRSPSPGYPQRSPVKKEFTPVPNPRFAGAETNHRPSPPPKSMSSHTSPRLVSNPANGQKPVTVGHPRSPSPRVVGHAPPNHGSGNQRLHPNHASRPTTPRSSPTSPSFPGTQKPLPRTSSMKNRDMGKHPGQRPAPPPHGPMGMQPYPPNPTQQAYLARPAMQHPSPRPQHAPQHAPQQSRSPLMQPQQGQPRPNGQPRPHGPPQRVPSPQPGMPYSNYRSPSPQPPSSVQRNGPQRPGPGPVTMRPPPGASVVQHSPTPSFDSSAVSISSASSISSERSPTPRSQHGYPLSPHLGPMTPEELGSPPRSPNLYAVNGQPNAIRQVLYGGQCEVFRWKDESWYAVEGNCRLEVRQAYNNRSCVSIRVENTNELYLNAWILSNTEFNRPSETDVGISVSLGSKKEEYLIHFQQANEALALFNVLQQAYQGLSAVISDDTTLERSSSLQARPDNVPQTLNIAMQCKCKLFVQNEHSNWSSFGSVTMKISQQLPSRKMHIEIENEKGKQTTKLVSALVQSRNVERLSAKRITVLLVNEHENISIVYMIQVKEEQIGDKIYEYLRTKNAENGW
ncbi:hypothetical protein EC973_006104 [Apophysomyces ossiformis]|uniref:DH domain-containing protein n=1 Tax=Apophysomyces ossiformis TaxID=679940 RepID=A0A8H7ESI2_9FUNG|nr:hypothetical protein EC973_006104 [Apophysomyces ossiformis]